MSENFFRILGALVCLFRCLLCSAGEEVVRLQELEGNTVTIHTGLTGVQSDAHILWLYGPEKMKIVSSQIIRGKIITDYDSERFRDRLQLNRTSGSLTITNISREDSGLYNLQIITESNSKWSYEMDVYAPAPKPNISLKENHTTFSREMCVLVCSVENRKDVSLSWYEEKERISNISSSDSSERLYLPLNVTNPNCSTYTCVAANPVSNQTIQLNITELCDINADSKRKESIGLAVAAFTVAAVCTVAVAWCCKRKTRPGLSEAARYNGIKYSAGSQQNDTQPCEPSVSFMSEIVQT